MSSLTTSPFVGRQQELLVVKEALLLSSVNQGQIIAVSGEPGMGKTRLLNEISHLARADKFQVVWSQMIEDPAMPPYLLWTLLFRALLQRVDTKELIAMLGESIKEVVHIVPELRIHFKSLESEVTLSSPDSRFQLFDSVTQIFLELSKEQPLTLLLDNLHLADHSSLVMLDYCAKQFVASNVLLVIAYREEEMSQDEKINSIMSKIQSNNGFHRLRLHGLKRQDIVALLYAYLQEMPSASLIENFEEQCEGNPLLVEGIAEMISERPPGTPLPNKISNFKIPENLKEYILVKLNKLPKRVLQLLRNASILGRDFELVTLTELTKIQEKDVEELLQKAQSAGVISIISTARYRFYHSLFRELLYLEQNPKNRTQNHLKVAEYLENRFAEDLEPHLSELAYHFFKSASQSDYIKAIEYCAAAAKNALHRKAYREASNLYSQALHVNEIREHPDIEMRFELLMEKGWAEYLSGDVRLAAASLLKPALLAHRKHWWKRLGTAVIRLQQVYQHYGASHMSIVPLHKSALDNLSDESKELKARLLASLSDALRMAGEAQKASEAIEESLEIARELADKSLLLDCLKAGIWSIYTKPEELDDRLAISKELLALSSKKTDPEIMLRGLLAVAFRLCEKGNLIELQANSTKLLRLARQFQWPVYANIAKGFEVAFAMINGQWQRAIKGTNQLLVEQASQGNDGVEGRYGLQMFEIQRMQGNLKIFEPIVNKILASSETSRLWLVGKVLLHCELEQFQQARKALQQLGDLNTIARDDLYLTSLVYLSDACCMLQDKLRCEQLYQMLLPFRHFNLSLLGTIFHGAAATYLGQLAIVTQRQKLIPEYYQQAIEMNEKMGALTVLIRTKIDYASYLVNRESPAEQALAIKLISEVKSKAQDLNLGSHLLRIKKIESGFGSIELTNRETEVIKLISAGASNKQIAAELNVSHSTVTTHVRNIFSKTGASNRTEAADFARRTNLV